MFQLITAGLAIMAILCTLEGALWLATISALAAVLWVLRARPSPSRRRKTDIPFASRDRRSVPIIR